MKLIGVINGPNLDRLGKREPEIYGDATLDDLADLLQIEAESHGVHLEFFQSNHEGELIDQISKWANQEFDGMIVNAAGLTHTSVALRDAIAGSDIPSIEVHISNVHAREEFRQHSLLAPVSLGVIAGLGFHGYSYALTYLSRLGEDD